MSLAMGVISRHFAFLMCDGFETSLSESGAVQVHDTARRKIFILPSGDRLIAIGSSASYALIDSLQRSEPMSCEAVIERVMAWGNEGARHSRNYFALVSRKGNGFYVWRGICEANGGWGENVETTDLSSYPYSVVLVDGFLGDARDEIAQQLEPLQFTPNAEIRAESSGFAVACKRVSQIFKKVYGSGGDGRIGGEIFYDAFSLTPCVGEEIVSTRISMPVPGGSSFAAVDANGNLLLKNKVTAVGVTNNPTTTSLSFASDVPEMSITVTTKGNPVLISFNGTFSIDTGLGKIRLFRDSTAIGGAGSNDGIIAATAQTTLCLVIEDASVPAGSHTYHAMWEVTSGGATLTATGISRFLQVVELG